MLGIDKDSNRSSEENNDKSESDLLKGCILAIIGMFLIVIAQRM